MQFRWKSRLAQCREPVTGLRLMVAFLALCLASPVLADSLTYRNERFGTTIRFPTTLFDTLAPPPTNGDGQTFLGREDAALMVYASRGEGLRDLAARVRQQLKRSRWTA